MLSGHKNGVMRVLVLFLIVAMPSAWADCEAGYYCSHSPCPYSSQCDKCPGGQYYETPRSTDYSNCNACPSGNYCEEGASVYVACPPGYFCGTGASAAIPCASGKFSASLSSTSCTTCSSGKYSCPGSSACTDFQEDCSTERVLTNADTDYFSIQSGYCTTDSAGKCFFSPNYPSNYGNMDSCNIYVNRAATLDVKTFSTESGYDTLEINGVYYMGTVAVQLCGQITLLSARITGRRHGV